MIYLEKFVLPSQQRALALLGEDYRTKTTCFDEVYPFEVFSERKMPDLEFDNITLLCGGNGSGKTTILNIIAERLSLKRGTYFNSGPFFKDYVGLCRYKTASPIPNGSSVVTSDDVFDMMLKLREKNSGIDQRRGQLLEDYTEYKWRPYAFHSMDSYEELKTQNAVRSRTMSRFVKERVPVSFRERSNGESAFMVFQDMVKENALYLLDEPENSLSVPLQLELKTFLEDSARFYGCQFIISTHSPILLSMKGALVYDLDRDPPARVKWTDVANVRLLRNFFAEYDHLFK